MRLPGGWGPILALFTLTAVVAVGAASVRSDAGAGRMAVEVLPSRRVSEAPRDRPAEPGNPDQARIHELDQRIKELREQFKAQADPLQAQVKALREKLDADLKPLEDERHELVERAKPPAIRELDADEATQLAALADREKAEVEKVHQGYAGQRTALKASFDQKRREARGGTTR